MNFNGCWSIWEDRVVQTDSWWEAGKKAEVSWLDECYRHSWDKKEDTDMKSSEFCQGAPPDIITVSPPRDRIAQSHGFQLNAPRDCEEKINAITTPGRNFQINEKRPWQTWRTVICLCWTISMETERHNTNTKTILHQLQSNYSTLTPSLQPPWCQPQQKNWFLPSFQRGRSKKANKQKKTPPTS